MAHVRCVVGSHVTGSSLQLTKSHLSTCHQIACVVALLSGLWAGCVLRASCLLWYVLILRANYTVRDRRAFCTLPIIPKVRDLIDLWLCNPGAPGHLLMPAAASCNL